MLTSFVLVISELLLCFTELYYILFDSDVLQSTQLLDWRDKSLSNVWLAWNGCFQCIC